MSLLYRLTNLFGKTNEERATYATIISALAAAIGIVLAMATLVYVVFFDEDVDNEARSAVMDVSTNVIWISAPLQEQINRLTTELNTLNTGSNTLEIRLRDLEREIGALQRELQSVKSMRQP